MLNIRSFALVALACGVANFAPARGESTSLNVPNHSFEQPPVPPGVPAYPVHVNWQQTPRRPDYVDNPPFTWEVLTGVFPNSAPGSPDHIPNTDGIQAAFLFAEPENGIFQELPDKYEAGFSYRLKVGITASANIPPAQNSTLALILYYTNNSGVITPLGTKTVTWTNAGPSAETDFVEQSLFINALQPQGNQAVGKNIGILIKSTATEATKGGVWDIDNVRVIATRELIQVPNFSFENPAVPEGAPAYPVINQWQKFPQPGYWNPETMGAWDNVSGLFPNPPAGEQGHIENTDRNQAGYLFATPQNGLFQDLPAKYERNAQYTLRVGVVGSTSIPPTANTPIVFNFFYRGEQNERITIAERTVRSTSENFPDALRFIDFDTVLSPVSNADWVGKNIGIAIHTGEDFQNSGGVWDIENVRLFLAHSVKVEVLREGDSLRLKWDSIPGVRYQIRTSSDLATWANFDPPVIAEGSVTSTRLIPAVLSQAFFTINASTP